MFLDDEREIFGRDEEFAGIEGHRSFAAVVLVNEPHELADISGTTRAGRIGLGACLEPFAHHAYDLIGEGRYEIAGYGFGEQAVAFGR